MAQKYLLRSHQYESGMPPFQHDSHVTIRAANPGMQCTRVKAVLASRFSAYAIQFFNGEQLYPRKLHYPLPCLGVAPHSCVFRSINEQCSQKIISNFRSLNGDQHTSVWSYGKIKEEISKLRTIETIALANSRVLSTANSEGGKLPLALNEDFADISQTQQL